MRYGWVFTSAPAGDAVQCIMQTDIGYCVLEVQPGDEHDALVLLTKHCYKRPAAVPYTPTMH